MLSCCGQTMELLKPGSVDAAAEKHVPALKRQGCMLTVAVGSIPHPMTQEHHIAWVAVAQGGRTQRVALDQTGKPCAEFCVDDGPLTVYAYCNLHGLWESSETSESTNAAFEGLVCSAEFSAGCVDFNE